MEKDRSTFITQIARLFTAAILLVQACSMSAQAALSDTVAMTVSIDLAPPGAVTGLSARSGVLEETVELTWTAPHEDGLSGGKVSGYTVKYATFSVAALAGDATAWWYHPSVVTGLDVPAFMVKPPGDTESNYIPALESGVTFYFGIRCIDDARTWSDFDDGMYGQQPFAAATDLRPVPPTGLAAVSVSSSSVVLTWDDMSLHTGYLDFARYDIERSTVSGQFTPYASSVMPAFVDLFVSADTTYYYRLKAVDRPPVVLESDPAPVISVYVPLINDGTIPRPPAGIRLSVADGAMHLSWSGAIRNANGSALTDCIGYRIYRSRSLTGTWESVGFVSQENTGSYSWTDASVDAPGAEVYYYMIRAVDASGNESADSMVYDTSPSLNVIALSPEKKGFIYIPQSSAEILYRGNTYDDDVVIHVETDAEPALSGVLGVYEFTARKATSDEPIARFQLPKNAASIHLKYDDASLTPASRSPGEGNNLDISMFWFNGLEWVKISSVREEGYLGTRSKRLGRYMLKESIRAGNFVLTKVFPRIFTPDGDNRNDHVEFHFENPLDGNVYGRIFNLQSALVGEMRKGANENAFIWDGRTTAGDIAAPGVYIYQIEITGTETKTLNGVIILAK